MNEPEYHSSSGSSDESLEKKLYHLRTLYEVTRELTGLNDVEEILNSFLALCMGPVGAANGFVLLRHDKKDHVDLAARGLEHGEVESLQRMTRELADKIFATASEKGLDRPEPVVFKGRHLSREPLLPAGTQLLVAFVLDDETQGMLGLGPRIDKAPYEQEDIELVRGLKRSLMAVLQSALAHAKINAMNARLEEQNLRLVHSLEEMERTRDSLDQRALQLQYLYDASVELSGLVEPQPILETFLLLILGSFSVQNGYLVIYDSARKETDVALRGMSQGLQEELKSTRAREVLLGLFVALKDRIPHIMESRWVTDPSLLENIPGEISAAVVFTIDEECRGVLGLGHRLTGAPFTKEEHRLMAMLLSQFMVSLDNARHFVMAQMLNRDLEQRNLELKKTLHDLTSARNEIDLLQSAKERILNLVRSEKERISHASWLDFTLTLVVSVVLGLLFNMASPGRIPLVPDSLSGLQPETVSTAEATAMHEAGQALFVDARPMEFYEQQHISGAENIPLPLFDFVYDMKLSLVDPETQIIVYGRTFSRHYDTEVAQKLVLLGHDNVLLLPQGLSEWPQMLMEEDR